MSDKVIYHGGRAVTPQNVFRTPFSKQIFDYKYAHEKCEDWFALADTLVEDVCRDYLPEFVKEKIKRMISLMQFIPGGRYLYYAGRDKRFFNNCYLLRSLEDSREDWANLSWKAESALMTGGGLGNDYSIYRPKGATIKGSGGVASGPVSKMKIINEIGREVMQGGGRRSALYASLNWAHGDAQEFLYAKDWDRVPIPGAFDKNGNPMTVAKAKEYDFNYPAPLDCTNISLNYDNDFLEEVYGLPIAEIKRRYKMGEEMVIIRIPDTYLLNCKQALRTAEPGFSFNFFEKVNETLRNACTEVTSEDDSDVCNLGSVNMSRIDTHAEFEEVVRYSSLFLLCGTFTADVPYEKVKKIREKNRRLGLGLMGVHEWLIKRGYRYEMNSEFASWLETYQTMSEYDVRQYCEEKGVNPPVAYRAIAPTGSIGILAGTTTGIEPLFATAFKRRYTKEKQWFYQYVVEGTAKYLIEELGIAENMIETSFSLAQDFERRISFQAGVQDYVDMAISSTINLPSWGSEINNEETVPQFAETLLKYAHRLRGFTCYPDGSRGGQPLTPVSYAEAKSHEGQEYTEEYSDICEISGKGGVCGA